MKHWTVKVQRIANFHAAALKTDPSHTMRQTAEALEFSLGTVHEALTLAEAMKRRPSIKISRTKKEAVEFLNEK